jgi:hypothetical protein
VWQKTATGLSIATAASAAAAAVSIVRHWAPAWSAFFAVVAAVLAGVQGGVGASKRVKENVPFAARYERLSNDYEAFALLELKQAARQQFGGDSELLDRFEELRDKVEDIGKEAPRIKPRQSELNSAEQRAEHMIARLCIPAVQMPARADWADRSQSQLQSLTGWLGKATRTDKKSTK